MVRTNGVGGIFLSNSMNGRNANSEIQYSENDRLWNFSRNGGTGNQILNNAVGTNTLDGISITNSTGNLAGNAVSGNLGFGYFVKYFQRQFTFRKYSLWKFNEWIEYQW